MTKAQKLAIDNLVNDFLSFYDNPDLYRIKEKDIADCGSSVHLHIKIAKKCIDPIDEIFTEKLLMVFIDKFGNYYSYIDAKHHAKTYYKNTIDTIFGCQLY